LRQRFPDSMSAIRKEYETLGVRGFYEQHGAHYRNPHEPAVARALAAAVRTWQPGLEQVLDLACGSGEATLALQALGAASVQGVDPFTGPAYQARTGQLAEPFTFEAVAAGALAGRRYSLIVCSYALHLLQPSRLPGLAYALSLLAPRLLVLTPHKRPHLRPEWGWSLAGELVVERVRARYYLADGAP
jgi:2-polyprenyl-3-methyl-5-hydroxy-6-metoxy-1,4-benzoquinol methylase